MRQPGAGTRELPARAAALLIAGLLALVLLVNFGCRSSRREGGPEKGAGGPVNLLITRDFGSRVIAKKTVSLSGRQSVLDVLSKNAKVETAYGGGFVNSINGLASGYTGGGGSKYDWLYCVNGVQASVGAAEYRLARGDTVWWDYHSWAFISSVPAVVGNYPEPFLHGYGGGVVPVAITYADGFAHEAGTLRDALLKTGAKNVTFQALQPGMERPTDKSIVLVGTWKQLSGLGWVADAAANPGTSGIFVRFSGDRVQMYDCAGQLGESRQRAGAILATGEAGQPAVAWLVTGVDVRAVTRAAGVIIARPEMLAGKFGAVVDETGSAVAVPRGGA